MNRERIRQTLAIGMGLLGIGMFVAGGYLLLNPTTTAQQILALPENTPELLKAMSIAGASQIIQGLGVSIENSVRIIGGVMATLGATAWALPRILPQRS